MALLGMSANMRCNGYFPGYHSTRDLVLGTEGSSWTSSNGNSELKNDCYQIGSLPLSSTCHLLGFNKEVLKQTILKHEAIFRDQKQRELMDEIKRNELHKHNLRLETSWSSSSLYYSQSMPQLAGQSSVLIGKSIPLASVQEKSRQLCPNPAPTAIKESLKDSKLSESSYRKVGKKILDLQLPADEYIDSEGESFENERIMKQAPLSTDNLNGISQVVYKIDAKPYGVNSNGFTDLNLPFKLEESVVKSDDLGGQIHHGNYTFHDMPRRMALGSHNLPNDAIQNLNKRQDLEACSDVPLPNQGKKQGWLSSGKNDGGFGSLAKFNNTERLGPSSASCSSAPYQLVSEADMTTSGISPALLWKSIKPGPSLDCQSYIMNRNSRSILLDLPSVSANDINSSDKQVSSSATHELGKYVNGSKDVGTYKNINLNIMPAGYSDTAAFQSIRITGEKDEFQDSTCIESFLLTPYKSGYVHSDLKLNKVEKSNSKRDKILAIDLNGKPHSSKICENLPKNQLIEEIKKISDVNSPSFHEPDIGEQTPGREHFLGNEKKRHKHFDLNSCMDEGENMAIDTDLHAPESPENKECSPPRGESDENHLEMPLQLAGEEDPEVQEEQAKTAAEALVSISGVIAQNGVQMTTCPSSEYFVSSSLHWFAGIVSTIVDHLESEVKVDFNGTIKDLEDFLPADFDYFEFMSLNLTKTKDLDCCHKSSGQKGQEGGSTSPTQPRKCRANKGRRGKDFQSEILPSLASLSRYEVTEDLQTIGGLVEAARTNSTTGYLKSAGRNVLARGRRKSSASASNITDLLLKLKELNNITEIDMEKRGIISWGKICRKRRGQRTPTSKPHFIFS
ncbi:uncharacterized protein LOC113852511 isoform X2 [Abrus precatorius]|uniref:Uncharacterized protein LOC113852511 isoform X2 n=1 Tax=Abrus precatorius TaxID=3816 RepID=A0A8B8K4C5_ABRPR|nr:uncharacterized protein LOC113852511 isoform X2 [Abrus precatorius]